MRYLLRIYYTAVVTGRKPEEFKYCDYERVDEVGLDLHRYGFTLQLVSHRLRALFRNAHEMDTVLFDEPLDLGPLRSEVYTRAKAMSTDPEATEEDRISLENLQEKAEKDGAVHQFSPFIFDVLIGWALISPLNEEETRRSERAMKRLVELSCAPEYCKYNIWSDAARDSMRYLYADSAALLRFAHAGGLPALINDWVCLSTFLILIRLSYA